MADEAGHESRSLLLQVLRGSGNWGEGKGQIHIQSNWKVKSTEERKVEEGPSELISPQLVLFAALTHDSQECFLKAVSDSLPLTDREGHVT